MKKETVAIGGIKDDDSTRYVWTRSRNKYKSFDIFSILDADICSVLPIRSLADSLKIARLTQRTVGLYIVPTAYTEIYFRTAVNAKESAYINIFKQQRDNEWKISCIERSSVTACGAEIRSHLP